MMAALAEEGGFLLTDQQSKAVQDIHWQNGKMTTTLLAQDIDKVLAATGLAGDAPENTRFLVLPQTDIGPHNPLTGEKMARFLALHRARDFDQAVEKAITIQNYQRAGHSLGLHSSEDSRARHLAMHARPAGSLLIRHIALQPAAFSITACLFLCLWGAAVGGAIQLMKTSTGRILSITSMLCVSSQKINLSWRTYLPAIGMSLANDQNNSGTAGRKRSV